jgi:hypothetical protein
VFLILNDDGSRVREVRMCVRCCDSLYAGELRQLLGRMGVLGLWTLTRPRILGGVVQVNDLPFGDTILRYTTSHTTLH